MTLPLLMDTLHLAKGLDPVADFFAGTVRSDVFNLANYGSALFVIYKGVGASGTSTITVNACDDATPSNRTAIPFFYKTNTSGNTWSARQEATASGFTTTAGSSQLYAIEVTAEQLAYAAPGYGYVELTAVEVVDSAVIGCILGGFGQPRYHGDVPVANIT